MTPTTRSAIAHARRLSAPHAVVPYAGWKMSVDLRTSFGRIRYAHRDVPSDVREVCGLLGDGDVFIDAGAHLGLHTLAAARSVGEKGLVIALEPSLVNRLQLERSVGLNRLPNVCVLPHALSDHDGLDRFAFFRGDAAGFSSLHPPDFAGAVWSTVPVGRLDTVWKSLGEPKVTLVKLDVEGAELSALKGAADLLGARRPKLVIEIEDEHLRRHGDTPAAVLTLLDVLGYEIHELTPPNILCIPRP